MDRYSKKDLLLSSLLILLPMILGLLFWNQLPPLFPTHIGINGAPDAWQNKGLGICAPPLALLLTQWLCLFITGKDPKNRGKGGKMFRLVLWIIPVTSLFVNGIFYCIAFGYGLNLNVVGIVPLGLMFMIIGNYLPKCHQNHTVGIKLPWTLANEENWNLTHRFGGKCWFAGGLAMVLCVFLPGDLGIWGMVLAVILLAVIPLVYSYLIYRRHIRQGILYSKVYLFGSKKADKISAVILVFVLLFVFVILFTGDISYIFKENSFTIEADFYTDMTVSYDAIDEISLHQGNVDGSRTNGFGSPRLLMGFFHSRELGLYTRYTYTDPECCVILNCQGKTLVLSGKTASETKELYQQLLSAVK